MNDILIKALYNRIKSGQMTAEQVPDPYKPAVNILIMNEMEDEKE